MKQVLLRGGGVVVDEVPAPGVSDKNILVRVHWSCISVGTEAASMAAAAEPLYRRAIRQPENVRLAFRMMQEQGVGRTIRRIRGMLAAGQPSGYSAAGEVVAIGAQVEGFSLGDRVACAGAGIANHAELIDVPVNLAVPVPDRLALEDACTVTLGAIALQGVRRAAPTLGETILVIGLGILGQLTVQLLKANGCRVVGVDLDDSRLATAAQLGMNKGFNPACHDVVGQIQWLTDGLGADAAIVTAAASGNEIISQAMRACRKKGRVVLVGDVGLDLRREDFYRKELDFLVSTSYGPGRYDPAYEEGGQDYPLPYVRWTENRNMAAYLALLAEGRVRLSPLKPQAFSIDEAETAYRKINAPEDKPLLVLLRYQAGDGAARRSVKLASAATTRGGRVGVAVVGAGGFAQGMHLPNLVKLRDRFDLRWIVSRTGATAKAVSRQYEVPCAGTDFDEMLLDRDVELVLIATRHHLHADLALKALKAGKHVFVEKPLGLAEDELAALEAFYAEGLDGKPMLMTGFNRRFAPPVQRLAQWLRDRAGPLMISYRMNAGYLPPDHWVHGPEGGGRNLGEACHIYDLFAFLTGAPPVEVQAAGLHHSVAGTRSNENFSATLRYADGSVAQLLYTSLGAKDFPKEQMDVFVDGKVFSLVDYRALEAVGVKGGSWRSTTAQKGQFEELRELAAGLRGEPDWPIPLAEQLAASRIALSVEAALKRTAAGPAEDPPDHLI